MDVPPELSPEFANRNVITQNIAKYLSGKELKALSLSTKGYQRSVTSLNDNLIWKQRVELMCAKVLDVDDYQFPTRSDDPYHDWRITYELANAMPFTLYLTGDDTDYAIAVILEVEELDINNAEHNLGYEQQFGEDILNYNCSIASRQKFVEAFKVLIRQPGINMNNRLYKAVQEDSIEIIKILLKDSRIDYAKEQSENNLIKESVKVGNAAILTILVEDPRFNSETVDVNEMLLLACSKGWTEVAATLINPYGADPLYDNGVCMREAIIKSNYSLVRLLLQYFDITKYIGNDADKITIFSFAVQLGNLRLLNLMIDSTHSPATRDEIKTRIVYDSKDIFEALETAASNGFIDILEFFTMELKENHIRQFNEDKIDSILNKAVLSDRVNGVKTVLNYYDKNHYVRTHTFIKSLRNAVKNSNVDIVKVLIDFAVENRMYIQFAELITMKSVSKYNADKDILNMLVEYEKIIDVWYKEDEMN